jgi:regulation of enolase protein 1 (concanavalin A-like superfamily)
VAGRATITAGARGTWVKLARRGNVFTAALSGDGTTWTNLAEQDLPDFGDAPYYIGLVVCSGDRNTLTTGVFEAPGIS